MTLKPSVVNRSVSDPRMSCSSSTTRTVGACMGPSISAAGSKTGGLSSVGSGRVSFGLTARQNSQQRALFRTARYARPVVDGFQTKFRRPIRLRHGMSVAVSVSRKAIMTTLKRILVPTDFGEAAGTALSYGRALAQAYGASLHVLHVTQDMFAPSLGIEMANGPAVMDLQREVDAFARKELER